MMIYESILSIDDHSNALIIDTEGMFQPKLGANPNIIREIILNFTYYYADHILFVFDKLNDQEYRMLNQVVDLYTNSADIKSLTVIHNRRNIKDSETLKDYIDQISEIFKFQIVVPNENAEINIKNKQIRHFFFGEDKNFKDHNKKLITRMKKIYSNDKNPKEFFSILLKSCYNVFSKYFEINLDDGNIIIDKYEIKVTKILNKRMMIDYDVWTPTDISVLKDEPKKKKMVKKFK